MLINTYAKVCLYVCMLHVHVHLISKLNELVKLSQIGAGGNRLVDDNVEYERGRQKGGINTKGERENDRG